MMIWRGWFGWCGWWWINLKAYRKTEKGRREWFLGKTESLVVLKTYIMYTYNGWLMDECVCFNLVCKMDYTMDGKGNK